MESTAHALAEAIVTAEVSCSSNGGEDTRACGFASGDVEVVARAQVRLRCCGQPLEGPHC